MTKSVKEKNRLTKIKELQEKGLPVTEDLIKTKISYIITGNYQKVKNAKSPFCTSEDVRAYIGSYLKQIMPTLISNLAKIMKQYEFKILFETKIDIFNSRVHLFFFMYVLDKKGRKFNLSFDMYEAYMNRNCNMIEYDSSSFDDKLDQIDNKSLLQLCLDEVTYRIKHFPINYCTSQNINKDIKIPNRNDKRVILKFLKFKDVILKGVFKKTETIRICLVYSDIVEMAFRIGYSLTPSPLRIEMKKFSKFDFLKILVDLNIIKSGIAEDDFNQSTIEDVIEFLKLENY